MFLPDEPSNTNKISRLFYLGIFLLSFCLLALEIILTRILSVVFWYHFAFLVISVALFGMTLGGIIVFLLPKFFLLKFTGKYIATYALISSLAIIVALPSLFYLPAQFHRFGIAGLTLPVLYPLLSLPFISIGICLSLLLSRFNENIGKIYCVNLIGSSLGCIGVIFILNAFNAASALLCTAGLCGFSSICFATGDRQRKLFRTLCILIVTLCFYFALENEFSNSITPLLIKNHCLQSRPLYSRWNFFSYITVNSPTRRPFGWGFSSKIGSIKVRTEELMLTIDGDAGTVFTKFRDLSDLEYLKLDISSLAYHLHNNNDVLVLGSGGGRDLFTAAIFEAKKIVGVEINKDIVNTVFDKFKWFSGDIGKFSQIRLVIDEGRSYVSKSQEKYDIIQASLVDSFAAFANGAFALTENCLYTKDAWVVFLQHLKENGVLTFSRWYDLKNPAEIYRVAALAKSSLEELGIIDPRPHIVLARYIWPGGTLGIGTILVKRTPFSENDLAKLRQVCKDLEFELVLSPDSTMDQNLISILRSRDENYNIKGLLANINPPTDDKPFFFYFANFNDLFKDTLTDQGAIILRNLFLIILVLGLLFIIVPLLLNKRKSGKIAKMSCPMIFYFSSIGLGFMMVEMSFMQRIGIYLGHPIYGLTVVLFTLLFSCGIGSYITKYLRDGYKLLLPFVVLLIITPVFLQFLPLMIKITTPNTMPLKIAVSLLPLISLGIFLGMPFPIGMRVSINDDSVRTLYWGINGFFSLLGSVVAAIMLINFGFQWCLTVGIVCYFIAFFSLLLTLNTQSIEDKYNFF
jgi:hypothetical protein